MLAMLFSGELRAGKVWKLAVALVPVFFCLIALAFILYGRWKEKRGRNVE